MARDPDGRCPDCGGSLTPRAKVRHSNTGHSNYHYECGNCGREVAR